MVDEVMARSRLLLLSRSGAETAADGSPRHADGGWNRG